MARVLLPIFIGKQTRYDITSDESYTGLWIYSIAFDCTSNYYSANFRMTWGWSPLYRFKVYQGIGRSEPDMSLTTKKLLSVWSAPRPKWYPQNPQVVET